jgi:hypothetical protein
LSGRYGTPGWDEPDGEDDDPSYDDDPPEPKPRPVRRYNRGGAGKRKGKSPHQHVRNWRWGKPHNVTFMRDWDYRWYRLTIQRFKNAPINARKVWRKTIHHHRLNRHRLKEIAF